MVNTTVILVVATTALSGIATGTSLDVSIRQLPARHRIGVLAYSAYSQATDLGTAVFWYISVGVGAFLFALAAAWWLCSCASHLRIRSRLHFSHPCGPSICSSRSFGLFLGSLASGTWRLTSSSSQPFLPVLSDCRRCVW